MPRKLKTYITSLGFFDLAVAAPSMKAALEAWGVERNIFYQGLAEQTDEPSVVAATMEHPSVVAATMEHPGVVLRRAVGTKGEFTENAELPNTLPTGPGREPKPKTKVVRSKRARAMTPAKFHKAAIIQFDKEKRKREARREKEEAEREKTEAAEDERRQKSAEKAKAARARALERHQDKMAQLKKILQAVDEKIEVERERWKAELNDLEVEIRKTRS